MHAEADRPLAGDRTQDALPTIDDGALIELGLGAAAADQRKRQPQRYLSSCRAMTIRWIWLVPS